MYRRVIAGVVLLPLMALATQGAWNSKEVEQWSEDDAHQVLTASPWVKGVTPVVVKSLTESQRRAGGQMGGGKGVGLEALKLPTLFAGKGTRKERVKPNVLTLRWESAMPIREAEKKIGENEAPALEEGSYAIAVYGIPALWVEEDLKNLAATLEKSGSLKINGKDMKVSRVDILQGTKQAVLVYLFPRSSEIKKDDMSVIFQAQIGKYWLSQAFAVSEMQFAGKLEL